MLPRRFEAENMKAELGSRREKVYELLDKLQASEDHLRRKEDECERVTELLESSDERGKELERRLGAARLKLAEREREVAVKEEVSDSVSRRTSHATMSRCGDS